MDSIERPNLNLPARLPASMPMVAHDLVEPMPASASVDSRQIFRGLIRNWWRILLLWLVASVPLAGLIYRFLKPTYEAESFLQIESSQQELFNSTLAANEGGGAQPTYLQTQIKTITSNSVLEEALGPSEINNLPLIKSSTDPKADLKKSLIVEIVPNTHYVRVALDSRDSHEAAAIVNAIVTAYKRQVKDYGSELNSVLLEDLKTRRKTLSGEIDELKKVIVELAASGNVLSPTDRDQPAQSSFESLTMDQYRTTKDRLMQTRFELMELEARAESKKAEGNQGQANGSTAGLMDPGSRQLRRRLSRNSNGIPMSRR